MQLAWQVPGWLLLPMPTQWVAQPDLGRQIGNRAP
jgi:hypothetical protein